MNLYFDEESQKLIIDAKNEMFKLKHPYVGSEHLFLAILNNSKLDVTKVLNKYGINYDMFRNELISVVGIGGKSNDWFLFTPLLKKIINNSIYFSKDNNKNVTPYSLLVSILQEGEGVANRILLGMDVDLDVLYEKFVSNDNFLLKNSVSENLEKVAVNMNVCSMDGKYNPVIGRDNEINELIQVLLRKDKNNPLLIGEAGVGKTAIVEELARRITVGAVPQKLKNKVIYNLSMSTLVAGTKYRGEFEEKINNLLVDVTNNSNVIIFIDEVHTLMGAGGAEGAIDASNILKPYLARGNIKLIGATTVDEYNKFILKDRALDRRFQKIYIEEPNKKQVEKIILGLKKMYEQYYNISISNDMLSILINLSFDSILNGKQPDKAIDLLDNVCSYVLVSNTVMDNTLYTFEKEIKELEIKKNNEVKNHNFKKALSYREKEMKLRSKYNNIIFNRDNNKLSITREDICDVIYNKYKVLKPSYFKDNLIKMKKKLRKNIYGQNNIIDYVLDKVAKYDYIINCRPLTFLLIGKKCIGKTFFVNNILETIFDGKNIIKLSMKEFVDSNSINKMLGMFYGDVGYTQEFIFDSIKNNPYSILFFDDIDCAHSSIINLLLQSFKVGFINNSKNEKINLSKCIIFMTANVNPTSIGFIDSGNNKTNLLFNLSDKIDNIIEFNDVDKKIISKYINDKLKKILPKDQIESEMNMVLEEADYENFGFSKIDDIIEKKYGEILSKV